VLHEVEEGVEEAGDLPLLLEAGDGDAVLDVPQEENSVGPVLPDEAEELLKEPGRLVGDADPHLGELVLEPQVEVGGQ